MSIWKYFLECYYTIMNNSISSEKFQERLENKHQNLLSERQDELRKTIESILTWVQFADDNQKEELSKSARVIAEHKHYPVDDKLTLLENLKKDNELNVNWWKEQKIRYLYWDATDDVVYQRMVKKWDLENIKLFLERKLPLDTYYSYLTDAEMRDLWNESMFLLYWQLQGGENSDFAEKIGKEALNNTAENTENSDRNKKELSEININSIKEAIDALIKEWIKLEKYTRKDIIKGIKSVIYRRTGLSTRGWRKSEFEKDWICILVEQDDVPEIAKSWDEFKVCVYCELLPDLWWYITVKIVNKPYKLKEWIDLSKFSEEEKGELMGIDAKLTKVFGNNKQDLKNYVDTFVSLREIWYKWSKSKERGWISYKSYCKRNWRDALIEKIKTISEQYPSLVDTQKGLCKFADKLLKEHNSLKMIEVIAKYFLA